MGGRAGKPDVGGEYAVYMMAQGTTKASDRTPKSWPESTAKSPANPAFRGFRAVQNLDAPPLSPYTSAVPEMDVNLNPRAAPVNWRERDQVRRPPRRLRCLHAESQGHRAVAEGVGPEARDREEDREGGAGSEGELTGRGSFGRVRVLEYWMAGSKDPAVFLGEAIKI
jgi:hypothetical protein